MRQIKWVIALVLILAMASSALATVTLLNKVGNSPNHWIGLSTDTKPTTGNHGSTFYAEDSGLCYMYGVSGWVIDNRNLGD